MSYISDYHTVEQAKKYIEENFDAGVVCPCCGLWVKKYAYSFHNGMARALIYIFQATEKGIGDEDNGFFHVERYFTEIKVPFRSYHGKLKYWGLIEAKENTDSTKHWSGYWRITQKGRDFVQNAIRAPKVAYLFNDECLGFDEQLISIKEALGKKFDYTELMMS